MSEFEKWWEKNQSADKMLAQRIWESAQRSLIRTIGEPPHVPKVGEKVRFLSLCNPNFIGEPAEVTDIKEDTLKIYWLGTKRLIDGDEIHSCGILGEVEPVV